MAARAQPLRLALATALHYRAQRVEVPRVVEEQVMHDGPRAQKTPPAGGAAGHPDGARAAMGISSKKNTNINFLAAPQL